MTYSHNAIDQVAAVRRAQVVVAQWHREVREYVDRVMPEVAQARMVNPDDWAVTVALLARDYETPPLAADRIARYLTLHAERWGETPTLNAIREDR